MVQTEIPQLTKECNQWIEQLHSYRDELNMLNKQLQETASKPLTKEHLTELEHFHNQLHIQLINVHDVKQESKMLNRKVQFQVAAGEVTDDTYSDYERVSSNYHSLTQTLDELRSDFNRFVSSV